MVTKKKTSKKETKKEKKVEKKVESSAADELDDDLGGEITITFKDTDEDIKKAAAQSEEMDHVEVKASKPVDKIKKGDKMNIDGLTVEVDAHYVLIDHGNTKEMAIECYDPKTDKDYQIRYFSDQVERSMEAYELAEILYNKIKVKKISW